MHCEHHYKCLNTATESTTRSIAGVALKRMLPPVLNPPPLPKLPPLPDEPLSPLDELEPLLDELEPLQSAQTGVTLALAAVPELVGLLAPRAVVVPPVTLELDPLSPLILMSPTGNPSAAHPETYPESKRTVRNAQKQEGIRPAHRSRPSVRLPRRPRPPERYSCSTSRNR